jgi:hypothetical protein
MMSKRREARRQYAAGTLLGDILGANLDHRAELQAVRDWVRRAVTSAKRRDLADDDARDGLFGRRSRAGIGCPARDRVSRAGSCSRVEPPRRSSRRLKRLDVRRHVLRIIT